MAPASSLAKVNARRWRPWGRDFVAERRTKKRPWSRNAPWRGNTTLLKAPGALLLGAPDDPPAVGVKTGGTRGAVPPLRRCHHHRGDRRSRSHPACTARFASTSTRSPAPRTQASFVRTPATSTLAAAAAAAAPPNWNPGAPPNWNSSPTTTTTSSWLRRSAHKAGKEALCLRSHHHRAHTSRCGGLDNTRANLSQHVPGGRERERECCLYHLLLRPVRLLRPDGRRTRRCPGGASSIKAGMAAYGPTRFNMSLCLYQHLCLPALSGISPCLCMCLFVGVGSCWHTSNCQQVERRKQKLASRCHFFVWGLGMEAVGTEVGAAALG